MTISVTFSSAHRIQFASSFFLARRPVLDAKRRLAAIEFLFCQLGGQEAPLDTESDTSLLTDLQNHGLLRLIDEVPAYLRIDAEMVLSEALVGLSATDAVMILPLEATGDAALPPRLANLRTRGFRFALDIGLSASIPDPVAMTVLPLVESVHFDIRGRSEGELQALCKALHVSSKVLVAEGVDTEAQLRQCEALGCMLFRGGFFLEPSTSIREISPSQLAVTQLISMVATDASNAEIEARIKSDPVLSLNLLHLVNTPALSVQRVESLRQALLIVGRNQLQRWLPLMLFGRAAQRANAQPSLPLLLLAASRASLMELLAQKLYPSSRNVADTAFTVGIMSLMDRLFGMTMPELLAQMPVVEEVVIALLQREGRQGELLRLAELSEWQGESGATLQQLESLLQALCLSHHALYEAQLGAFEWSGHVVRSIG